MQLCAVGDIDAMAGRAYEILTDAALRERFVKAGRHTAESRFSTETIIPQYEAFYEELLARGRQPEGVRRVE